MLSTSQSGIALSYIMPVFFNQKNINVLLDLLDTYSKYDRALLKQIQFVIVDDCSPIPIEIPDSIQVNYVLYRITTDITWNQAGARNLGVVQAADPRIILTDCDHVFPERLLEKIVKSSIPRKTLYKFKREDATGRSTNSACNIFYTSKSAFFSSLGYDEEFCGNYGYEDVMFRHFQKKVGNDLTYFTRWIKIVSNTIDRENSYHNLVRDTSVNQTLLDEKMKLLKSNNIFSAHSRIFLNFEYTKMAENRI